MSRQMRIDGKTYNVEGDGFNPIWLFVVAFALCLLAAMWYNSGLGFDCSYRGCSLPATVMMKSPAGTVGGFCDPHSAEMYGEGWRVYP